MPSGYLTTNIPQNKETSHLICNANQLTGFYMIVTLIVIGLTLLYKNSLRQNISFRTLSGFTSFFTYDSIIDLIFHTLIDTFSLNAR